MKDDTSDDVQEPEPFSADPDPGTTYYPEPDYGAGDYIRLPNFGVDYYSLADAALVAALDMWVSGDMPASPPADNRVWPDEADSPAVREAIEPTQRQLAEALMRSVEAGHLVAEVLGRTLTDSRAIPERTFILLQDLVDWLEVYGHERGDFIAELAESEQVDPWDIASKVASDRARLRLSHLDSERSAGTADPLDELAALKREVRSQRLHINHLQQQLKTTRTAVEDRPLTTRRRRTLLTIIAALCRKAAIQLETRGAAVTIASATAELGVPVGEDVIRTMLREIPDAIESRSR
jgi:hypothetical protein